MELSRQTRRRLGWIKSFLKRTWDFEDYPVDFIDQGACSMFVSKRFTHHRWRADLLGSHISGLGDDKEQALIDAKAKFAEYKQSGGKLRRPGSQPVVMFAGSDLVDRHPDLQRHFINAVLKLDWAVLTDESALWDFHGELDNSESLIQIWHVYGVDASHLEDGNIAAILSHIIDEIHYFPEDEAVRAVRMGRDARDRQISDFPVPKWIQEEDDAQLTSMDLH